MTELDLVKILKSHMIVWMNFLSIIEMSDFEMNQKEE
jgi:hypothetical protein